MIRNFDIDGEILRITPAAVCAPASSNRAVLIKRLVRAFGISFTIVPWNLDGRDRTCIPSTVTTNTSSIFRFSMIDQGDEDVEYSPLGHQIS